MLFWFFFDDSNNWGNVKITPLCSRHFLDLTIYYLWWCDNLGRREVNQSVFITIFSCVTTGKLKSAGKWEARCLRNYQSVNYQGVKISVEAISLDFKQTVATCSAYALSWIIWDEGPWPLMSGEALAIYRALIVILIYQHFVKQNCFF